MQLRIFVPDGLLRDLYKSHITKHNTRSLSQHPDAGFDLFCPTHLFIEPSETMLVKMGVKMAAFIDGEPTSFYLYPRSSIFKTKLRLANSVGIIDSGYRGELAGAFDNIGNSTENITQHSRLLQVCAPNLQPIFVEIVDHEDALGQTARGQGGFGSTGA